MSENDEAPVSTGATSETLGRDSDDDTGRQFLLTAAKRTIDRFVDQVRSTGTLMPGGRYPQGVVEASELLARRSDQFIEKTAVRFSEIGADLVEVHSWKKMVKRRLNGRAIRVHSAQSIMSMADPEYLIHGLIERESFAMLYAESGLGKTFVALSWCYQVALGEPWLGLGVAQGPAVYVGAEGVGGLPKRLRALTEDQGRAEPPRGLYVIPQAIDLIDMGSVNEAVAAVEDVGIEPALVVLDTWARSIPGADENSAKDTGEAVASIDDLRIRLNTAVLIVHHTGKTGGTDRGSGALTGAVDTKLKLAKANGRGDLVLVVEKQKNFEAGEPITLRLETVADSLVPRAFMPEPVSWHDVEVTENRDTPTAQAILKALRTHHEAGHTPITQTALLVGVTGSTSRKGEILRSMVDDPSSPVAMEKRGKSHLYTLKDHSDSLPPTP